MGLTYYHIELMRIWQRYELMSLERMQTLDTNPEPRCCSVFGCGHHLSPQEQLYGSRCPEHSIKQAAIDPTAFTVYK